LPAAATFLAVPLTEGCSNAIHSAALLGLLNRLIALDALAFWADLSASRLLASAAAVLLVFVSGGVVYLSTVEWRDRRRRARLESGVKAQRRL
jgi:hypothetical protein